MGDTQIGVEMQEITGDIWEQHSLGRWVVITTNGVVKKNGTAVMGRGIAEQAAIRHPTLPYLLGNALEDSGNKVHIFEGLGIITFPTKHHWRQWADLELIEESLRQLVAWADIPPRKHGKFYMIRPGCANGRRDWRTEVKPLCEQYLDDRFVIVEWNG